MEQGFQLTLDDNPRLRDYSISKVSTAHWRTEITTLPKGTKLQTHNTQQGQIGMIAPTTTLTPQGPADTGYAGDYWQFNTQGELVRVHRQYRKTLLTHHQEHSVQSQQSNLRTTGKQPSDSRMVQQIRLRTSIKQWKGQTKQGQNCPKHYSNSLQQRHSQGARHYGPDITRLIPWRQTKVQPETSHGQAGQSLRNIRSFQHKQTMRNNNRVQKQKRHKQPTSQDTRAQRDTPPLQEPSKTQTEQSPKATQQASNHTA